MENFNQTSPELHVIRLRIKTGDLEFEAEGQAKIVIQQFEKFQNLINGLNRTSLHNNGHQVPPAHHQDPAFFGKLELPLPSLERIFETDLHSSILLCRIPPKGKGSEAKLALLLLLGYLEIRGVTEVPVLTLKQAIKLSLYPVIRLDRVIHNYIKDRFVIKIGRGKGGKYRLTPLGIKKAFAIAGDLTSEWNQA